MRKLGLLVLPLMTMSLLASCGGGGETPVVTTTYTMTFNGSYCTANNKEKYNENEAVSFEITPQEGYVLPTDKTEIAVTGSSTFDYVVNSGVATFSCTMTANTIITIVANTEDGFRHISFTEFCDYMDKYNMFQPVEGGTKLKASWHFDPDEIHDLNPMLEQDYYETFINSNLLFSERRDQFIIDYNKPVASDEEFSHAEPYVGSKRWWDLVNDMYITHTHFDPNAPLVNDKDKILAIRTSLVALYNINGLKLESGAISTSIFFDLNKHCITHMEIIIDNVRLSTLLDEETPYTFQPFSGHILLDWFDFAPIKE